MSNLLLYMEQIKELLDQYRELEAKMPPLNDTSDIRNLVIEQNKVKNQLKSILSDMEITVDVEPIICDNFEEYIDYFIQSTGTVDEIIEDIISDMVEEKCLNNEINYSWNED